MAETKGKKRDPARAKEKRGEIRQLVLTLNVPRGEIVKIEARDAAGHHQEISEKEFAAIAGEDELVELGTALEEAYAAGLSDAIDGEIDSEFSEDEDEDIRRTILREAAARQLLKRGLRRLVLRRALRRGAEGKHAHPRNNGGGAHRVH